MFLSCECLKYLLYSTTIVNTNPSQHTNNALKFYDVKFGRPVPHHASFHWFQKGILWWKWIDLGINKPLKLSKICSIRFEFPPQTMMLKMMNLYKSPSQHPKSSPPSLTYKVFETQHILSRYPISINLCPTPSRFLHQTILISFP